MQTITELALARVGTSGAFTREQAAFWVGCRGPRLDGLLKRAVAEGEVWRIRQGVYALSDRYRAHHPNPLEWAQLVHGPSYVSLESALSYHGWIPEGVQAITSVGTGRSRSFASPVGLFTYTRVPQKLLLSGVRRLAAETGSAYFMAVPLKALGDLVYARRLDWISAAPVVDSLRVEPECLATLTSELFDEVLSAYRPGRVSRFLAGLRKELDL